MATLYDIDSQILDCIDIETGEIIDEEKLNALQMERNRKIEGVALWVKNLEADVFAFGAERKIFEEKERIAKKKRDALKEWLSYALNGQKFTSEDRLTSISFRRSESVKFDDEKAFVDWAQTANRDDLLSYKEPTANKTAIKAAIKAGETLDGAYIIEKQNIQIK